MYQTYRKPRSQGIAIFFAVIFVSITLAVALGVSDLIFGEQKISQDERDSKRAFYNADSGAECMLYWGLRKDLFSNPNSAVTIDCFGLSGIVIPAVSGSGTTVRFVTVKLSDGTCTDLEITRVDGIPPRYILRSRGQTACTPGARSTQFGQQWVL